jgi:predicted secreted hydrolase
VDRAKPEAALAVTHAAVKAIDFKEHALTPEERASAKFARDWKNHKDLDTHWWVVFRAITTIGVVGDKSHG